MAPGEHGYTFHAGGAACKCEGRPSSKKCNCPKTLEIGPRCEEAEKCPNKACGYVGENDDYKMCRGSGLTVSHWFKDYCAGLPKGQQCKHDDQCVSQSCPRGTCGEY